MRESRWFHLESSVFSRPMFLQLLQRSLKCQILLCQQMIQNADQMIDHFPIQTKHFIELEFDSPSLEKRVTDLGNSFTQVVYQLG